MGWSSLFEINKFFCCASLRLGSFIIGYLGLIAHVLQTAGGYAQLQYFQTHTLQFNFQENVTHPEVGIFFVEYMAVGVAYHFISAIFHIILLWGIHKMKPELILPWLIVKGFECVAIFLVVTTGIIIYAIQPEMEVGILFLLISIFTVCIYLALYTYSCVYSHYLKLKSAPENEKELPPAYITSFVNDKKQSISDINLTQNVV